MMDIVLGIVGLVGVLGFIILLIISFIRKTARSRWVIGLLASVLFISFSIMIFLNDELNQQYDLEARFEKSTISEKDIRGFAFEVVLRDVMGEEYEDVMESIEEEFGLSEQDMWNINIKAQEILLEK